MRRGISSKRRAVCIGNVTMSPEQAPPKATRYIVDTQSVSKMSPSLCRGDRNLQISMREVELVQSFERSVCSCVGVLRFQDQRVPLILLMACRVLSVRNHLCSAACGSDNSSHSILNRDFVPHRLRRV